jgi:hypothetical protein
MVAEGLLYELDNASEDSMWYTDDPHDSWQHDSPSSDRQQQHAQPDESSPQQQEAGQQAAGQDFLRRLTEAVQRQRQEDPSSRPQAGSEASDAEAGGAYFDDSYFGLPAEPSGAPQDLQELQAVVSKNLEVGLLCAIGTFADTVPSSNTMQQHRSLNRGKRHWVLQAVVSTILEMGLLCACVTSVGSAPSSNTMQQQR